MGFQYDNIPRSTEIERKIEELKTIPGDFYKNEFSKATEVKAKESLNIYIKPNKFFIEAHNKREEQKSIEKKKDEFLNSIDNQGFKIEKIYNEKGFQTLHDPLAVYSSKGNYDDLAWKVFQDVHSDDTYLRALYYPELRSEDYNSLLTKFRDVHSSNGYKNKFKIISSVGGIIGGFLLSSKLNLKYKTSIGLSLASGYLGYSIFNCMFQKNAKKTLNSYASINILSKYPELKFTSVSHGQVN